MKPWISAGKKDDGGSLLGPSEDSRGFTPWSSDPSGIAAGCRNVWLPSPLWSVLASKCAVYISFSQLCCVGALPGLSSAGSIYKFWCGAASVETGTAEDPKGRQQQASLSAPMQRFKSKPPPFLLLSVSLKQARDGKKTWRVFTRILRYTCHLMKKPIVQCWPP